MAKGWVGIYFGGWVGNWLGAEPTGVDKDTDTPLERTRFEQFPIRNLAVSAALREISVPVPDRDEQAHEYKVR